MTAARPPAVAGTFYPGNARQLAAMLSELLAPARAALARDPMPAPKAVVAPHAGYVYSGSTAALAYARVESARDVVRRVVLLGPCHRLAVHGLALPGTDAFDTPLGRIPVDPAAVATIAALPQVTTSIDAHAAEHSLEVHLPFLQTVLDRFTLLPLAVGRATPEEVAEVVDALWGGPETLIVASSDLSHYLPYQRARTVDQDSIAQLLAGKAPLDHQQACGATPVNGVMLAARRRGLEPRLLGACNSGDTAGDRDRVVGYASFALAPELAGVAP
ncbi:MAG: AmmeMemoRadiSam system protein B [Actinobacteria bacterium]|nr:AmmeMemoRadiSam system protein B [Actinomycetota bacterium]